MDSLQENHDKHDFFFDHLSTSILGSYRCVAFSKTKVIYVF